MIRYGLVALMMFMAAQAVDANAQQGWTRVGESVELHDQGRFIEVHQVWSQSPTLGEVTAGFLWFNTHLGQGSGPAFYAITLAGLYSVLPNEEAKKKALLNMYFFELRQFSSIFRCDDDGIYPSEIRMARTKFAPYYAYAATLSDEAHEAIIDQAFEIEKHRPHHDFDFQVCARGLRYMQRHMQVHGTDGNRAVEDPSRPGTTVMLEFDESLIEFVDDETWEQRRADLFPQIRQQLIDAKP
jgi:hypothetical protein